MIRLDALANEQPAPDCLEWLDRVIKNLDLDAVNPS